MPAIDFRTVSKNGLRITTMGLGGTGLGNMYRNVDTEAALGTVHAAYAAGLRYFDTAPVYGLGVSETRLGQAIKSLPRGDIVISSKVGYDLVPIRPEEETPQLWINPGLYRAEFDYSKDGVKRSFESSLKRLDTDKDGKISLDEFVAPMKAHFARMDANRDGFLDETELKAPPPPPEGGPDGDGPPPLPPEK